MHYKKNTIISVVVGTLFLGLPIFTQAGWTEPMENKGERQSPSGRVGVIQPPLPESQMRSVGVIRPMNGRVNVKLNNTTGAQITYQVIGHTDDRSLSGGQAQELLDLPVPVTITAVREDDGLIDIQTQSSESGELEVMLDEEPNLGGSNLTIRIQEDGTVFVY